MTGKTLYDKHCTALKDTERWSYKNNEYVRVFPDRIPPAWQFANGDLRNYYNRLAQLLTPKPRKQVAS